MMTHKEPVREVALSPFLRVYVSDVGALVIEQTFGDTNYVCVDAKDARRLASAIVSLAESAAAKEAAYLAASEAEYRAWKEGAA